MAAPAEAPPTTPSLLSEARNEALSMPLTVGLQRARPVRREVFLNMGDGRFDVFFPAQRWLARLGNNN